MARRREGRLVALEVDILGTGMELQAAGSDFYGFALAKHIAERSDAAALTAHGTLYKALARLTRAGLLEATWEDATLSENEGRPRRRLYRVTGAGELAHQRELAAIQSQAAAPAKAAFA